MCSKTLNQLSKYGRNTISSLNHAQAKQQQSNNPKWQNHQFQSTTEFIFDLRAVTPFLAAAGRSTYLTVREKYDLAIFRISWIPKYGLANKHRFFIWWQWWRTNDHFFQDFRISQQELYHCQLVLLPLKPLDTNDFKAIQHALGDGLWFSPSPEPLITDKLILIQDFLMT